MNLFNLLLRNLASPLIKMYFEQLAKRNFTTDEIKIDKNEISLIESKHSRNAILPSIGDIKDGLLKMILYTNLKDVFVEGKQYNASPVLKLTSPKLKNSISKFENIDDFSFSNRLNKKQKEIIIKLFEEAEENNFKITIERAE